MATTTATPTKWTGAMIALQVPDAENFALTDHSPEALAADDLHITLAYLGESSEITPTERAAILEACQVLADTSNAPEALFPATSGVFPPDPEMPNYDEATSRVPYFAAPSNEERFSALREDLMTHLAARGVASIVSTKHPVFHPHVTLTYEPLTSPPDLSYLPTPLPTLFHTLIVKFGDEVHSFELGQPVEGPELPLTASVRSTLVTLSRRTETAEDYLTALYLRQRQVRSTPAQTRAQAALNNVHLAVDPHYRSTHFNRIQTLAARATSEVSPATRLLAANRALALASKTAPPSATEARELASLTASLRALIADGNSSAARSLRARRQLRDRYGRWIEMGGGVRFKIRVPGAPGGGTWYHGTVTGFDIPNGKVNVELEDGRTVAIPNTKIEQPKAVLNLGIGDKLKKAAGKTFKPKSSNREGKATLPNDHSPEKAKADKLDDDAAVKAMDGIQKDLSETYTDAKVSGGNIAPLVNDPNLKAAEGDGTDTSSDTVTFKPSKKPAGTKNVDAEVTLHRDDIATIRKSLDRLTEDYTPSKEKLDALSPEEQKKELQTARSKAYGRLATLYNERGADQELLRAPSVGTDEELQPATPSTDVPAAASKQEIADAVDQAFQALSDLVPDTSPLSAARDKIQKSLADATSRHAAGEDDDETFAQNLDMIKEFANAQEPSFGKATPEQQAFGAFAEDLDDIHASVGGKDNVDQARAALQSVPSLTESDASQEGDNGAPGGMTDEHQALNDEAFRILDKIDSGEYLGNSDALISDMQGLRDSLETSKTDGPLHNSEQSVDEVLGEFDASIQNLKNIPGDAPDDAPDTDESKPQGREKAEPDAAPGDGDGGYVDSPIAKAIKSGETPVLDELDSPSPVEDYTDAPEGATTPEKASWEAYSDAAGSHQDVLDSNSEVENGGAVDAANFKYNGLLSDWYEDAPTDPNGLEDYADLVEAAGLELESALRTEDKFDSAKIDEFKGANDKFVEAIRNQSSENAPEAPSEASKSTSPSLETFQGVHSDISDLHDDLEDSSNLHETVDQLANEVANIGTVLQQGKTTPQDAADALGTLHTEISDLLDSRDQAGLTDNFDDNLESIAADISKMQADLAKGNFNDGSGDGGGSDTPVPTPPAGRPELPNENWDSLDSVQQSDFLTANDKASNWIQERKDILEAEPDFESGQGSDFVSPDQAIEDFSTLEEALVDAKNRFENGDIDKAEYENLVSQALDDWENSEGYSQAANLDGDGVSSEYFNPYTLKEELDKAFGDQVDALEPVQAPDAQEDPWALPKEAATTDAPEPELVKEHVPEAEDAFDAFIEALQSPEFGVEEAKDAENAAEIYHDKLEEVEASPTASEDDKIFASGEKDRIEKFLDTLNAGSTQSEFSPKPIDNSKNQGIVNQLSEQDSPVAKFMAQHLQDKIDKGEPLTQNDYDAIKELFDTLAGTPSSTPAEKADMVVVSDTLDPEGVAPAPEASSLEVPDSVDVLTPVEKDQFNAEGALEIGDALDEWAKSLEAHNAIDSSPNSVTPTAGSSWNEMTDTQKDNLQKIADDLPAKLSEKLQTALDAHNEGGITDDALIATITDILWDAPKSKKIRERLRGAQAGIQTNKGALVPILRPNNKAYKIDGAHQLYLAAPAEVKAVLKAILEQAAAGVDFKDLVDSDSDDAKVKELIEGAAADLQKALDAMAAGDVAGMISSMRAAMDKYNPAVTLRLDKDVNDKVVRRLRARRRALEEVLAGLEGRWPDDKIMGNPQKWDPGVDSDPTRHHTDVDGNETYPGDQFERLVGEDAGQIGTVTGWRKKTFYNIFGIAAKMDQESVYRDQGITQKSFRRVAVGPNNPLYHDPSYTGPRTPQDILDAEMPKIESKFKKQQAKKAKAEKAKAAADAAPTPTPTPAPAAPATPDSADTPAPSTPPSPEGPIVPAGETYTLGDPAISNDKGSVDPNQWWRLDWDSDRDDPEYIYPTNPVGGLSFQIGGNGGVQGAGSNYIGSPDDRRIPFRAADGSVGEVILPSNAKIVQVNAPNTSSTPEAPNTSDQILPDGLDASQQFDVLQAKIEAADNLEDLSKLTDAVDNSDLSFEEVQELYALIKSKSSAPGPSDLINSTDMIQDLKDLPVGSKINVKSPYSDFMGTWEKKDDGWYNNETGDGVVVQHFDDTSITSVTVEESPTVDAPESDNAPSSSYDDFLTSITEATTVDELNDLKDQIVAAQESKEIGSAYEFPDLIDTLDKKLESLRGVSDASAPDFQVLPADQRGESGDGWLPDGSWGKYGAAGIVISATDPADGKKKILVGQRGSDNDGGNANKWLLPGGAIEQNETPAQGAARELLEEAVGLEDKIDKLKLTSEHVFEKASGWKYTTLVAELDETFDVSAPPGAAQHELVNFKWVDADELAKMDGNGELIDALSNGALAEKAGLLDGAPSVPATEQMSAADAQAASNAPGVDLSSLSKPVYDIGGWKKIGNGSGFNTGGFYEDPDGNVFYVKEAPSSNHAKNEVLGSALYETFGLSTSKARLGTKNGSGTYVVTPAIEGAKNDLSSHLADPNSEWMKEVHKGMAIDALLGNYDIAGPSFGNIISDANGKPVRIDHGATLEYRGTGAKKSWWSDDVIELDQLRNASNAPAASFHNAAKVFGTMTDDDVRESAKALLSVSPEQIAEVVDASGLSAADKKALKERLAKRRHNILEKTGLLTPIQDEGTPENVSKSVDKTLSDIDKVHSYNSNEGTPLSVGDEVVSLWDGNPGTIVGVSGSYLKVKAANGIELLYSPDSLSLQGDLKPNTPSKNPIFMINGKEFFEGDKIATYSILNDKWTHGTVGAQPAVTSPNEIIVSLIPEDGTLPIPVGVSSIISKADFDAMQVKPYEAPSTDLGAGYHPIPEGAIPLFAHEDYGHVVVQHPNGDLYIYKSNGLLSEAWGKGTDSYTKSDAWKPWDKVVPAAAKPSLPAGYPELPEGSKILFKSSAEGLAESNSETAYLVEHADGSFAAYHHVSSVPDGTPVQVDSTKYPASYYENAEGWDAYSPSTVSMPSTPVEVSPGPSGPMDLSGKEISVGDTVTNKGGTKVGKVVGITKSGQVKFQLEDSDGLPILNEIGKPKFGTYQASKVRVTHSPHSQPANSYTPGAEADPTHPLYDTPKPVAPESPTTKFGPFVSDEWMAKADQMFRQRKINKGSEPKPLEESAYYNKWTALRDNGDTSSLDWMVSNDYISQEMHLEATLSAEKVQALVDQAAATHQTAMDEHTKTLKEWNKANGIDPTAIPGAPKSASEPYLGGPADWSKGVPGTPAAADVFSALSVAGPELATRGSSFMADSDSIEDLDVRVRQVINSDSAAVLEAKLKLTSWAGDALYAKVKGASSGWETDNQTTIPSSTIDPVTGLVKYSKSATYTGNGSTHTFADPSTGIKITFTRHPGNYTNASKVTTPNSIGALHNQVRVEMPVGSTAEDFKIAMDYLGISQQAPARPVDVEDYAKNKLIALVGGMTDVTDNIGGDDREAKLVEISNKMGISVHHLVVGTDSIGRTKLFLNDEAKNKLKNYTNVKSFVHNVHGYSSVDVWVNLLSGPMGGLQATNTRWAEGMPGTDGSSSTADMNSGGADYIFTTVSHSEPSTASHSNQVVLHPDAMLRRTDIHGNSGDAYGAHVSDIKVYDLMQGNPYEITWKHGIPTSDFWYVTISNVSTRTKLINKLHAMGIYTINGIPIEQFVLTPGMAIPQVDTSQWSMSDLPSLSLPI